MTRPRIRLRSTARALVLAAGLTAASTGSPGAAHASRAACPAAGEWRAPASGAARRHAGVVAELAGRDVVLLGERHAVPGIQRWQLHTVAALHAREPNLVLAFEAFPRGVQPVLDRWVAGDIEADQFLRQSRWDEVWGLGTEQYLPLFWFARMHRIPMLAMNVERALVSRVGREGWAAVPVAAREGIGDPAPVSEAYRRALSAVALGEHGQADDPGAPAEAVPEATEADTQARVQRFIEAQSTWDRAFAEAIAGALRREPRPLVVVIVGRGHVQHGHGVPRQLRDLGVDDVAVALTHDAGEPCEALAPDEDGAAIADVVFGLDPEPAPRPGKGPRLGVTIESSGQGEDAAVRVASVAEGSVAESAGIRAGDIIFGAAGVRTSTGGDLVAVIRRQAPGTWLPLSVRRDGGEMILLAKFPAAP